MAAREVQQLFTLVRRLRERGVTILYITHRMNEPFEIADTCTVLRDGEFEGSVEMIEASAELIVEMMFGETAKAKRPARIAHIAPAGVITRNREKGFVTRQIADLAIKVPEPMLPVSSLSGGNQQKGVIGNWLNTAPKVMFFDEPSRGVDVQAKRQIFDIIWDQAERGLAAIFVSTELEEVLEVADRILVIRQGRIVAEVDPTATIMAEHYRLCMEGPTT